MTTYRSNSDWTRTQAAQRPIVAPDAPTMATYFPPPQAYSQPYVPAYAWSAEQPEFNSAPPVHFSQQAQLPWYARPRVLAIASAGFVAAAAAGLFGALHGSPSSAPVNMATHSAPAPAGAPAPAPMPAAQTAAPTHRSSPHSSMSTGSYSKPVSHQAPPQTPPAQPTPPPVQTDQSGQSDPSQWNNSNNYRWNYSGDHDNRWNFWNRDHDHRWNFFNRDHDSDSSGNTSHDQSNNGHDQSNNSNSSDSNQSGDSK